MADKKKGGGWINRLIMGSEKSEGYARSTLPSNRWELFWDIFKGRFGKLFIINVLVLLFCLLVAFLVLLMNSALSVYGSQSGFSQNIGVGYPAIPEMTGLVEQIDVTVKQQLLLALPICLMVAAVGISGGAYVVRNMVWTEGIFVANDFWKGVKQNYFVVMGTLLVFSVIFYLTQVSVGYADLLIATQTGSRVWLIIGKGFSYVFLAFAFICAAWMITMGVTYDLKFTKLIKNALLFTVALLPQNLFFLLIACVPFLLFLFGGVGTMIGVILCLILGFSWFLLVWTDYSQWAFDKFINDRVPGAQKNRGIYEKVSKTDAESIRKYREQLAQTSRTVLTRRPIKPITDDDLQLAELPETYGRADLQRLQESREALYRDNDEYVAAHKDDPEYQPTEAEKEFEAEREARKEQARLELEGKHVRIKKIKKEKKKKAEETAGEQGGLPEEKEDK